MKKRHLTYQQKYWLKLRLRARRMNWLLANPQSPQARRLYRRKHRRWVQQFFANRLQAAISRMELQISTK